MISSNEVIEIVKKFSLKDKLLIIEEILRNIREENSAGDKEIKPKRKEGLMSLAGVIDEEEAMVFKKAIEESRKIDHNEW